MLTFLVSLLFKVSFTGSKFVLSFFIGDTIVGGGWYIQLLLLFYILWYLSYQYFNSAAVFLIALCITVLNVMVITLGLGSHLYLSNYAFLIGCFMASYKEQLDDVISNHLSVFFIFVFSVFLATYIQCFYFSSPFVISYPVRTVVSLAFCLLFYIFSRFKYNKDKDLILEKVGKYSLEIYVLQGIAFILLRNCFWNVSDFMFVILSVIVTFSLAFLCHPIFVKIMDFVKK